jgi:hypothetical protein
LCDKMTEKTKADGNQPRNGHDGLTCRGTAMDARSVPTGRISLSTGCPVGDVDVS